MFNVAFGVGWSFKEKFILLYTLKKIKFQKIKKDQIIYSFNC